MIADAIAQQVTFNVMLNLADAVTTRAVLTNPRLHTWENNPSARPFVQSDASAVVFMAASALADDWIARRFRSHYAAKTYLTSKGALEVFCILNNERMMRK